MVDILQILLHHPAEEPQMKDLAFAVSPGSHTLLAIKIKKVSLFIFKLLFLATTVRTLSDLCKMIPVFFLISDSEPRRTIRQM